MKRLIIVALVLLLAPVLLTAQTFEEYENSIQEFANGVANSLPLNSAIGLTWGDSYIGQFPHFGIGATVGFSSVPYAAVKPVLSALSLDTTLEASEQFQYIEQYGAPFPAYAAEARIGGFILPFDIGVKLGTIPPNVDTTSIVDGVDFDYFLAGANVRLNLMEEKGLLPEVSVGGGYNYLRASVGLQGLAGGNITIDQFTNPVDQSTFDLILTDPTVEYFWQANVIDLQAQASKKILLFTPFVGAGASIGFGSAGGGLSSNLTTSGGDLTQEEIDAINTALAEQDGETLPKLGENGFSVTSEMPAGWAFRAYGGVSVNLLIVKIDITGMYDFIGQNYGISLGARVQL